MSLSFTVYTKQFSDDVIPEIIKRLNHYEMIVEAYPNFCFKRDSGFLPFKFQLTNPPFNVLKNKELKSGFELYMDDFNLRFHKANLQPKKTFFDKLFSKGKPEVGFANSDVEYRLKDCDIEVTFAWSIVDSFELRFATLTSAILSELTNGVCYFPPDNIWYNNKNIVDKAYEEIKQYENSLNEKDLKFHEFDEW